MKYDLIRLIRYIGGHGIISDCVEDEISLFTELCMIKSFIWLKKPILRDYQLHLLAQVHLSDMGVKGNTQRVDFAIVRLKEEFNVNYTSLLDDSRWGYLRSQAIAETIAVLEFKVITKKDPEGLLQENIAKFRLLRSINQDMHQFLIIGHDANISEEKANSFYNPEAESDPNNWKKYYELHIVPQLSKMDYFVTLEDSSSWIVEM